MGPGASDAGAALGLLPRVREHVERDRPRHAEVTELFWAACHGGQQDTAGYLLERGADLNWVGYDDLTPLDAARRSAAADLVAWLEQRGARSAQRP